jgi:replication factor C small subunit
MKIEETLWVEKFRPESLDEVIGHEKTIDRLKKYVEDKEVPHMIFAGPAGTGKTATITAFAREVFGDGWRSNLTEMNASDERGIDDIRNKVKTIARSSPSGEADYKIIFLDEADQLTRDAQPALRRIMEDYSDRTRFFLSCNYPEKLIDPLQSRCTIFRFGRLSDEEIRGVIKRVASKEELECDPFAIDKIIRESRGDARRAINTLQSSSIDGQVTPDSVKTVTGVVNDALIEEIVDSAIEGDLDEAMSRLDVEVLKQGANTQTLCDSFLRVIKRRDMPAPGKAKCIDKIAECEWRVLRGANSNVQFHSLLVDLHVGYHLDFGGKYGK